MRKFADNRSCNAVGWGLAGGKDGDGGDGGDGQDGQDGDEDTRLDRDVERRREAARNDGDS